MLSDGRTTAYMLVDPITGVLNGCRHKKGTGLIVKKLLFIQNWEEHLILIKQYKNNKILDCCFYLKLSIDAPWHCPKAKI